MRKSAVLILVLVAALQLSCRMVSDLVHDDEVVSRVGDRALYRSELERFIPSGVSSEDSIALSRQYINTWAVEGLIQDLASEKLSKQELDVSEELEDYRRSLIKYRYEKRYINDRLDTVVVDNEIDDYYDSHKDMFKLQTPIVKARFLDIMKGSPRLEELKRKMASTDYEDMTADSLAWSSALRYVDCSDEWVDLIDFARNFEIDYGTLLSKISGNGFVEIMDEQGDLKIGYIMEMRRPGATAPIEYCQKRIKDIIISNRRRALMSTLERDLLDDALEKGSLIIY